MRRRALRAFLVAVLAAVVYGLAAAFGGFEYAAVGAPSASAQYQYGNDTAVVGLQGDPQCLNMLRTPCGGNSWWTAGVAVAGAHRVSPGLSFEPVLVDHVDVQRPTRTRPFALTYHIKPEAVWSDGTPVSAQDFIFTRDVILDPANEIADRYGYDRIEEAVAIDGKTVRFVFGEPYAGWKTLFPAVLPKHVLEGHDFDQVWNTEIADPDTHEPIGSGPFLVTSWVPGWLTMKRNPLWWGPHAPALDAIVFRFLSTPAAQAQAIKDGEVDLIHGNMNPDFAGLLAHPGIVTESNPGAAREHLDFNLAAAGMPLLQHQWFRRAFAYALDRQGLVTQQYGTTNPGLPVLQNLLYITQQPEYEQHFHLYSYSPSRVASLMRRNGCVLGGDGIWSCGGVRARIEFATTTGNPRRAEAQDQIQAKALAAGFELVDDNSPGGVLFGTRLPAGDYELVMFAWANVPDPYAEVTIYGCGGVSNFKAYCSQRVTTNLTKADAELDPRRRASLVNGADKLLAMDAPSIPLYQIATFLGYRTALHGPSDNISPIDGPTWNVEDWSKS